jgi:anti-sigma regulatory factor (Ser/Thr protein kinase)
MDTPLESRPILGSVTIPGKPSAVASARAFVTRVLATTEGLPPVDSDAATLLTSELVTNAIRHTESGAPGGTVTVIVVGVPDGMLVEVVDDGSTSMPVVKGDPFTPDGHGLFLVQQLAAQWGYLRDTAGTTVWFHLSATAPAGFPDPAGPAAADVAADAAVAVTTAAQIAATSPASVM